MNQRIYIIIAAIFYAIGCAAQYAINEIPQARWGVEVGMNIGHGFETSSTRPGFNIGVTGDLTPEKGKWYMDGSLKFQSQPCGMAWWWGSVETGDKSYYDTRYYTPYYLVLTARILGHRYTLSPTMNLTWSVGPTIGFGLFGRAHARTKEYAAGNMTELRNDVTYNIFSDRINAFSTSRLEAGLSIRIATTLKNHYRAALEYNLMHILGEKAVDNMAVWSINVGYVF